ncbi:MAG TPA: hypothetical protein VMT62_07080 [Syntrophorhabdaceae bacterium]|nr:hypothetical protein [Syntrophorhabdaceae bacterium]
MSRNKVILFIVSGLIVTSCCCTYVGEEPRFPSYVSDALYIPPSAKDIQYRSSDGLFTVGYRANICYPARDLIKTMAASMRSKGWERLKNDPFTPGMELPLDYPDNDRYWRPYPWLSYWRDKSGNVVQYTYDYDVGTKPSSTGFFEAVERSCSLRVSILYYYPGALEKVKKFASEHRPR